MKRYSLTYFIGQSFRGLWRNGVMSFASVAVLMSCLVVMGSFVMLLMNINYNLDNLGVLNHIAVFVDPSLTEADETASESSETGDNTDTDTDTETADYMAVPTEELFRNIETELDELADITVLDGAYKRVGELMPMLHELYARTLDTVQITRLASDVMTYRPLAHRIETLTRLEMEISGIEGVDEVIFVSKAAALEAQKEKYSDYANLFDYIKEGDNSLPDQFTVVYSDVSLAATLSYRLSHLDGSVYKVNSRTDLAQQLDNVKQGIIFIFLWFLVILLVVSMFVIVNTIRVAIFARHDEIAIMRYVGATNFFITLPFLLEGLLIGLISSGLGFVVLNYAYYYIQKVIIQDFGFIAFMDFASVRLPVALCYLAVGVLTSVAGSFVSLQKYLKA